MSTTVSRRVVHFGGFYPSTPEAKFRHFQRQLDRFCATWSVTGTADFGGAKTDLVRWRAQVSGGDWASDVEYLQFRWDETIEAERNRSWATRLPLGFLAFFDYALHGALIGYFRLSWRYAAFFLYPFVVLALFPAAAFFTVKAAFGLLGWAAAGGLFWLAVVALFVVMVPVLGTLFSFDHILDNWIFAMRTVRGRAPEIEAKLDRLAAELAAAPARELLIVGHSFGAVHAAMLIERMIGAAPVGPPIRFAALGSSIPKLAIHTRAGSLRRTIAALAASPRVIWADFTSINDWMNFHRVEPVKAFRAGGRPSIAVPVKFRPTVSGKTYKRLQRNLLSMHNQFIGASDRRARYDFPMMALGPFPLEVLAQSVEGAAPFLDDAGRLTAAGAEVRVTGMGDHAFSPHP